jgi:hypothetical protein
MLSKQEEQAKREAVLRNDQSVREKQAPETGTYFSHTHTEAGGRFEGVAAATVVGSTPAPSYPALPSSSPWAGQDPVGQEPPLGFAIDEMPLDAPTVAVSPSDALASPVPAPSSPLPDDVERTGTPLAGRRSNK